MYRKTKKPFLAGVIVIGSALLISAGTLSFSTLLSKNITPDVDPIKPEEYSELVKKYNECIKNKQDPLKVFKVYELAQISMGKFLQNETYFTVGFGTTESIFIVPVAHVSITNALIKSENKNGFEESISYSDEFIAQALANSKRDYELDNLVNSYNGKSTGDKYSANWESEPTVFNNKDDYFKKVGKVPSYPFLYDVTENTTLSTSTVSKTNEGYTINLDLDPSLSTTRYIKRMAHLSGNTPDGFYSVNLIFDVDSDFNLISTKVKESYEMKMTTTNGTFDTKYYTNNVPKVPSINEKFDYTPYL